MVVSFLSRSPCYFTLLFAASSLFTTVNVRILKNMIAFSKKPNNYYPQSAVQGVRPSAASVHNTYGCQRN